MQRLVSVKPAPAEAPLCLLACRLLCVVVLTLGE